MNGLIVIPVYNEMQSLPDVIKNLTDHFPVKNLLFINDGSTDDSAKILADSDVSFLQHPINLGYKDTMKTAMHYVISTDYQFFVFFDADGQHRVEDLKQVINCYQEEGYDCVLGSRYLNGRKKQWSLRQFGTSFFAFVTTLMTGTRITDPTCGLKLLSRKYIHVALDLPTEDMHSEFLVGLSHCGAKIKEVAIQVEPRHSGTSMYNFWKATFYPIKTVFCLIMGIFIYHHLKTKVDT